MSLFRRRFGGGAESTPPEEPPGRKDALRAELRSLSGSAGTTRGDSPRGARARGAPWMEQVALGLRPIASALRLRAAAADLDRLIRADGSGAGDLGLPRLLGVLESLSQQAGRLREGADLMRECLAGLLDALGRLEQGELDTAETLSVLRDRLTAADDISDLEELRAALLDHANALIDATAQRTDAIAAVAETARDSEARARALEVALQDATSEARTDPLTGLLNRRGLDDAIARHSARGTPVGVLAIDLDRFKRINDEHGHSAGDAVLRVVADLLRAELRGDDEAFRVGGEEMLVLLFEAEWQGTRATAERLRTRLARRAIPVGADVSLRVTMSIGVALWAPPQPFDEASRIADQALYRAKESGRNRVVG